MFHILFVLFVCTNGYKNVRMHTHGHKNIRMSPSSVTETMFKYPINKNPDHQCKENSLCLYQLHTPICPLTPQIHPAIELRNL